jgi:all-trans-retinol 13,14-reductase
MSDGEKVVILGSGIGGLICGAILAKEGYKVIVLEKNKQIGGCLQIFVRDRHIFNASVHYIGGVEKGQNLYKILKYLGIIDHLELEKLDENATEKIVFHTDGKEYNIAQGYPAFIKNLLEKFPEEATAINTYVNSIQSISNKFSIFNNENFDYFDKSEYLEINTKAYIESLTSNTRLQNVLAGNNLVYAGVSDKTPLFIHALVVNSYIESAWVFKNGSGQIAKHLARVIFENGGFVKKNSHVTRIVEQDGIVQFVETDKGEVFKGDVFISNIHPANTINILDSVTLRKAYKSRIKSLKNSVSIFTLNIIFKPETVHYQKSNYYCYLTDNVWDNMEYSEENWPLSYALFYGKSQKNPLFAESATVMVYMKYDEVAKWEHSYNVVNSPEDRGEDYEVFKTQKAEIVLDIIEQKFPDFRSSIQKYYTSTPLTYRDYMGTEDGSIYGVIKDCKAPIQNMISSKTKIKNLLLVGQNITVHGVHGVAMSSILSCGSLIGLPYLLNKIENAQD